MANNKDKQYVSSEGLYWFFCILATIVLSFGLLLPYPFNFIPILIPIAILSVFIILKFPFWGLLIYSIFFLIRPQEFLGILSNLPIPLEKFTAILLLISLAFKIKFEKQLKLSITNIDKSLLFFLFITLLSAIFSMWLERAWEIWYKLFSYVIVYFMITHLVESKKQLKYFIYFIIFTSVFHAGSSIFNYYNGVYQYRMGIKRAIGMGNSYGNPNSLAATMAYTLPFIYYIFVTHKKLFHKLITILVTLLILWCIILTGSRTGMVGVIFISIYLMWQNKNKFINITLLLILGAALWVVMPSQYQGRFLSTTDVSSRTSAAASAHGRIDGLINGFIMLKDKPVLGYGIGCFIYASGSILGQGYFQAHSLPGQLMGEVGLLGILAFIVWMYYLFRNLKIIKKYKFKNNEFNTKVKFLHISLKVHLLSLFLFGLAGHNLYRYNWFIVSAIIVVLLNMIRKDKSLSSMSKDETAEHEYLG